MIQEITKELFEGSEVRILGTYTDPLFVAADIGKLIGIKDVHKTIKNYDVERKIKGTVQTPGGQQEVSLLTKMGLYKILFKSDVPVAIKFQKWVCEVIEKIRLRGSYQDQHIVIPVTSSQPMHVHPNNAIKPIPSRNECVTSASLANETTSASLSDSFADSSANKSTLSRKESSRQLTKAKQPLSPLELVQFEASNKINQLEVRTQNRIVYNVPSHDITKYTDKPCVYLFHLRGNEYKYGVTDDILKRAKDHQGEFGKYGITITLEEIYECRSTAVARLVESRIKIFAMTRGHDTPVYGKTEIITTEDINAYAYQIQDYVKIENEIHDRVHGLYADNLRLREKALELQIIQATPTELNIQLMQMKIRIMELENERFIVGNAGYHNEIKK